MDPPPPNLVYGSETRLRRIAVIAGIAAVLMGALAVLGWWQRSTGLNDTPVGMALLGLEVLFVGALVVIAALSLRRTEVRRRQSEIRFRE
jgi:heme A synthase